MCRLLWVFVVFCGVCVQWECVVWGVCSVVVTVVGYVQYVVWYVVFVTCGVEEGHGVCLGVVYRCRTCIVYLVWGRSECWGVGVCS
jgi:hypothetical protein